MPVDQILFMSRLWVFEGDEDLEDARQMIKEIKDMKALPLAI